MTDFRIFELNEEGDLDTVANYIAKQIDNFPLILLKGDLGAGKTTLAKKIIKKYCSFEDVTSPTFNLVNIYEENNKKIFHYDLYRIKYFEEILELGIRENLGYGITIIEWPEIMEEFLEKEKKLIIKIEITRKEGREVNVKGFGGILET